MSTCPECGNNEIFQNNGEEICRACGLVVDDTIFESSTSTEGFAERPYLAKAGTQTPDGKIYKALWLQSTRERNLNHGLSKVDVIASKYKLPGVVVAESKLILKKSIYANINIGRDSTSLIYASVYIACNIHGIPKTPLELTAYSEISITQLMKGYRLIKKGLQIETKLIDPLDLLPRFASKLDLKQETIQLASELLVKMKESGKFTGSKPDTILAGAIYIASQQGTDQRTQRQITKATGITEVAIRKIIKKFFFYFN